MREPMAAEYGSWAAIWAAFALEATETVFASLKVALSQFLHWAKTSGFE